MRVAVFVDHELTKAGGHRSGFSERYAALLRHLRSAHETQVVAVSSGGRRTQDDRPPAGGALTAEQLVRLPRWGAGRVGRLSLLGRSFVPVGALTRGEHRILSAASRADVAIGLVHPNSWWFAPAVRSSTPTVLFAEEKVEYHVPPEPGSAAHALLERFEAGRLRSYTGNPDVVAVISPPEAPWARSEFPRSQTAVVPHAIDVEHWSALADRPPVGGEVVVVGHMSSPRVAGDLRAILLEVARLDTDRCVSRITVVSGSAPDAAIADLAIDRLDLVGAVDDPRPYYQRSTAVLVPPFYLRGSKTTVLQGWAARRPVVTTTAGAASVGIGPGDPALAVGSTPTEVAVELLRVVGDGQARTGLVEAGWRRLVDGHTPVRMGEVLEHLLAAAVANGSGGGTWGGP